MCGRPLNLWRITLPCLRHQCFSMLWVQRSSRKIPVSHLLFIRCPTYDDRLDDFGGVYCLIRNGLDDPLSPSSFLPVSLFQSLRTWIQDETRAHDFISRSSAPPLRIVTHLNAAPDDNDDSRAPQINRLLRYRPIYPRPTDHIIDPHDPDGHESNPSSLHWNPCPHRRPDRPTSLTTLRLHRFSFLIIVNLPTEQVSSSSFAFV